jgi:peptide/nickel transport system ATP-binding protein
MSRIDHRQRILFSPPDKPGVNIIPAVLPTPPSEPNAPEPLFEVRHLTKQYGSVRVVEDVSFTIHRGETLGLVGESGSGKSTVARLLLRLIEPTSGQIFYNGHDLLATTKRDLRRLRSGIQMVFQDPYGALNPRMSIRNIVAEPFAIQGGFSRNQVRARLQELMHDVGLDPDVLSRFPHEFSGGQRQRINIARALALKPAFLALDEPVSALDVSVGAQVINLLRDLQRAHNLTYLFISHSMPLVRYLSDRVAVMQRGRLVELGTVNDICERPADPYTQTLIAATPELPTP